MKVRTSFAVAIVVALAPLFAPASASAHIALQTPSARYAELKEGPCGRGANDQRTGNATTFQPGQTIQVSWIETVDHPGHFRIMFDDDGTDAFVDPTSFTDVTSGGEATLKDDIPDQSSDGTRRYSTEVTLPDVECDKCTLQVIQVMTDKPPYGDGNDLYYQCADLVLSRNTTTRPTDPPRNNAGSGADAGSGATGGSKSSGGCGLAAGAGAGAGSGGLALFGALGVLARRRRRRRDCT